MKTCNLNYLKSISPESNNLIINIITLFLNNTPQSILIIKDAIAISDWDTIQKFTHKIKPSLSILGLKKEIVDTFLKINELSKGKKNLEEINSLFDFFETEIEKVYLELHYELTKLTI